MRPLRRRPARPLRPSWPSRPRGAGLAVLGLVTVAALVGAGCSDDESTDAGEELPAATTAVPPSSEEATTSTTGGAPTTSGPTTTAAPTTCTAEHLAAELGPSDAGAGQLYVPLVLRNTGASPCRTGGFPGVSVLDSSGDQLGAPATREGPEGAPLVLEPGGAATATLHTTNGAVGGTSCEPTSAQLRVFPPDQTEALTIPAGLTVCGGFSVTALVAGTTGTS